MEILLAPDLEPQLGIGYQEQQGWESTLNPLLQSQDQRSIFGILENPIAGTGGYFHESNSPGEVLQSNFNTPSRDVLMSTRPEWPSREGLGFHLSPSIENSATFKSEIGGEVLDAKDQILFPYNFSMKSTIDTDDLPSGPTSHPSSLMSGSSRTRNVATRSNRRQITRKRKPIIGREAIIKRFPPTTLVNHLENEFQSNENLTNHFKWRSKMCLAQLKNIIRHEIQNGSSTGRKFLSGGDNGPDELGYLGSPEISSPYPAQLMDTPNLDSPFQIHSDTFGNNSPMVLSTENPSLHSPTSTSKTIYYCTYRGCGQQYKTRADWVRHETTNMHWMQDRYMCPKCVVIEISPQNSLWCKPCSHRLFSMDDAQSHCLQCHLAKKSGKTFPRKDKFLQHLRVTHGINKIPEEMESWKYGVDGDWPRQCGFCGKHFKSWEERVDELEEHFKAGKTMADYRFFYPFPADSMMQYPDLNPRKDSDDEDDGSGGWGQQQGGVSTSWGCNSDWAGNNPGSSGEVQMDNGSSNGKNGMQYFRSSDAASLDLIPSTPQTPSPVANLVPETAITSQNNDNNNEKKTTSDINPGNKTLEVLHTHHLLHSALSNPLPQTPNPKPPTSTSLGPSLLLPFQKPKSGPASDGSKKLAVPKARQQQQQQQQQQRRRQRQQRIQEHDVPFFYRLDPPHHPTQSQPRDEIEAFGELGGGEWAVHGGGGGGDGDNGYGGGAVEEQGWEAQVKAEDCWTSDGCGRDRGGLEGDFKKMLVLRVGGDGA